MVFPVQISLVVLGCVDPVLEKKLNFDLKTQCPGSGEVGEGGRRGESQQFFRHVRASHTLLGKLALFPHRQQIPDSSRIDVRIRGELYFFPQFIRYVLRFSYEIGKKQLRIIAGFVWIRPECRIHYDVQ